MASFTEHMDRARGVLKSDNEPGIQALTGRVTDLSHPTAIDESPEHEPRSNRLAERCLHTVNGLGVRCRTNVRS